MPIYEYRCEQGHTFEVMQRMTDDPLLTCQSCEAPVQRVFHPVAVHFKGSGFYNTDYGTRKRAREKGEGGEGGGSSESKSDSKSDTATSTKSDTGTGTKSDSSSGSSSGGEKKASTPSPNSGSTS